MPALTRTAIENALRAWIISQVSALGTGDAARCVFEQQGAPHPSARPYATVKVGSIVGIGQEHKLDWEDPAPAAPNKVKQTMAGDRRLSVSVQFYGEGALDYARDAATGLMKSSVQADLAVAGLAPIPAVPTVQDLTKLNQDYEERGQFDAEFLLGEIYTDEQYVIESATGTATFEYPEGTARSTINFDTKQGA